MARRTAGSSRRHEQQILHLLMLIAMIAKEQRCVYFALEIFHELLHLVLDAGKCGKIKYEPHYEQGLNILADVLREAWQ